jgi:hypothetical protein
VNRGVPCRTACYGTGATCRFSVSGGRGRARAALGVKGSQVRILSSRRLGQGPLNRQIPGSAGFLRVLVDLLGWSPIVGVSIFRLSWEEFGSIAFPVAKWGRVCVCESDLSRFAGSDVFGVAAPGLMRSCRAAGWYLRG